MTIKKKDVLNHQESKDVISASHQILDFFVAVPLQFDATVDCSEMKHHQSCSGSLHTVTTTACRGQQ